MLLLQTGGTIDKLAVRLPDGSFDHSSKEFGETHMPDILAATGIDLPEELNPSIRLFMIDSLDFTEAHRKLIQIAIHGSEHGSVLITHGTDTMVETAQFLQAREELAARSIVLTGAMVPFSMGESSDAVENVRGAIGHALSLPAGVYISMGGEAFLADNVYKDYEAGAFRPLHS